jgi:uncharacterized protein (DUF1697 family)
VISLNIVTINNSTLIGIMQTYISILRGINVSGHRKMKMDALQQLYTNLGFSNVQTYIQSGNVVFQYKKTSLQDIEQAISKKVLEQFGFDVPVIVLEKEELNQIIRNNPFISDPSKDIKFLHITFLSAEPSKVAYNKIDEEHYNGDEFKIINKSIYLYCPNGYGKTKLTNSFFENKLKVTATTRNWKTTKELLLISEKLLIQ